MSQPSSLPLLPSICCLTWASAISHSLVLHSDHPFTLFSRVIQIKFYSSHLLLRKIQRISMVLWTKTRGCWGSLLPGLLHIGLCSAIQQISAHGVSSICSINSSPSNNFISSLNSLGSHDSQMQNKFLYNKELCPLFFI